MACEENSGSLGLLFFLADARQWSQSQAIVVSLLSGLGLILVVFMVACGVMTKSYRRATRYIRQLIINSTTDLEMATSKDVTTVDKTAEVKKKKGGKKKGRVLYRRSEKKRK